MTEPLSTDPAVQRKREMERGVNAALRGLDHYVGRDWSEILCFGKTLAVEVRRLRKVRPACTCEVFCEKQRSVACVLKEPD